MTVMDLILIVLALACFVLASVGVSSPRVALLPLGLAFWIASLLL